MKYRRLGRTDLRISEIGFGAWGIGGEMWKDSEDEESVKALNHAIDLGINFIDTALAYGNGHSEKLISDLIRDRSEEIYIATKIPPKNYRWPAAEGISVEEVFPSDYIIKCTERSLKNLNIERIDLQQLHVWRDEWLIEGDWIETVNRLKEGGKIKCFGISINDHAPETALDAVKSGIIETVQVIYNIFDQSPRDTLFPLCEKHDVGVIVRVPFDEGGLTGKITPDSKFPPRDWRNSYFKGERKREVRERVEKLRQTLNNNIQSLPEQAVPVQALPELALRFCLSHPAVSTVIPGMRKINHVTENCRVSDGHLLPEKILSDLGNHKWKRNFYED